MGISVVSSIGVLYRSVGADLAAVASVIAVEFMEAVAAEFFEESACHGKSNHGFGGDSGSGDHADIGALVGCLGGLAGFERDRGERSAEGGDGLEVASDD